MQRTSIILTSILLFSSIFSIFNGTITADDDTSNRSADGSFRAYSDNNWYIDNETIIHNVQRFSNWNVIINSTGSITIEQNAELYFENVNLIFNLSGNGTPTIHVLTGGKLIIKNTTTRILFSWPTNESYIPISKRTNYQFIINSDARLEMSNSLIERSGPFYTTIENFSEGLKNSGFKILSSNILIDNCTFNNSQAGLFLANVSKISINNCNFQNGSYGVIIENSNNVTFNNCSFSGNVFASCMLTDSGKNEPIELINCTINNTIPPHQHFTSFLGFELKNSNLSIIGLSYSDLYPLNKSVELDERSELNIYWYLKLLTLTKKGKPIDSVAITITDNTSAEVFSGKTNESGELAWIALKSMNVKSNEVTHHNPFKITASNKNKKYSGSKYIILTAENSAIDQIINMTKKKEDKGTDIQDMFLMYCICIMVVISVFIILFSINIFLAKKKLGLDKFGNLMGVEGKRGVGGNVNSGLITCSECGTQVTEDAAFCPHCGELFEGDEFECSGCLTKLSAEAEECPVCGKVFIDVLATSAAADKKTGLKSQNGKDGRTEKTESMYCSECGAVVGKTEKRCPGCGLTFDDSKKYKKVDGDTKRARHAYKVTAQEEEKLKKTKQTLPETLPEPEDEDRYMCSMCGASVNEQAKTCPKCGTELE